MVSVIIPNFNHQDFLEQRIDSVLNQSYTNIEIIILDDCSRDNSMEVINKYRNESRVAHVIFNNVNSGSTFHQWIKGVELANREWIWIAESDDFCTPNFLSDLLSADYLTDCGIRYCQSIPVNEHNEVIDEFNYNFVEDGKYSCEEFLTKYLLKSNSIPNVSAVLVRSDIFKVALNDLKSDIIKFKLFGDWLLWIRICQLTKIGFLSKGNNFHRFHSGTVRSDSVKFDYYLKELSLFRKNVAVLLRYMSKEQETQLLKINKKYEAHDIGSYACMLVRKNKILKALPLLITATLGLNFNTYYLKSALYWFFRRG